VAPMVERRTPGNIAILYAITGFAWILFSDNLVAMLVRDPQGVLLVSQMKGWAYVLVTSLFLYWLIKGATRRLVQSEAMLRLQAADLAQSREILLRYELLASNSRDMILFLRLEDGRILEANAAALHAYGYSLDEMLAMDIHDLRAEGDSKVTAGLLAQADARGILFETVHRCKDGSSIPVEVSSQGATIGNQRTIISVIRDISTRKEAEQALQEAYAELEHRVAERTEELSLALADLKMQTDERLQVVEELREKERLLAQQSRQAAMGEMIGNIAHQWRQPLNALGLTIQQLSLLYELGEFNREALNTAVRKSMTLIKHMSRTIDDFRDFFSPDKEKSEFRVDKAVSKAVELVRDSLTERRIAVEIDCQDEPVADGYPNEYSQVLLNILINARDAFDSNPASVPLIRIAVAGDDGRAVVTVTDNAGGIPDDILGNIFDPYFSTKGLQGTGIGLYMSKTIIERNMHGSLSVHNTGEGAQFRIEI
jgi:PAS domain S-box-containing protein